MVDTIKSARDFGDVYLIVVVPRENSESVGKLSGIDLVIHEKEAGLGAAINLGISSLPIGIDYVGWVGDDDLLTSGSGSKSVDFLDMNLDYVMTFGMCRYIDQNGGVIGVNKSGQWAVPLLRFGPDLVPQPGSIFRRSIFEDIGKIDTKFQLAFDFDLFIRLSIAGRIKYLPIEVGSFRWHDDSKSVKTRKSSVLEASKVRRNYLPSYLNFISWVWELPVIIATYFAGVGVTRKARQSTIT